MDALADYEGFILSMNIDSTADDLVALSEGGLTAEQAQQILDSSFTISSLSADDPADAQFEMAVDIAGQDNSVEMKFVENTLYLRADVAGIMEVFGADPAQLDAFVAQTGGQPGFEFVEPAINGEWIAMTGFDQLLQQAGANQNELTDGQKQAVQGFATALEDSSDVEAGNEDGPGTNLVAGPRRARPAAATHEVMVRGTFANIRLRNMLAGGKEGGWTAHLPDGEVMTIYDAAVAYEREGTPL